MHAPKKLDKWEHVRTLLEMTNMFSDEDAKI